MVTHGHPWSPTVTHGHLWSPMTKLAVTIDLVLEIYGHSKFGLWSLMVTPTSTTWAAIRPRLGPE